MSILHGGMCISGTAVMCLCVHFRMRMRVREDVCAYAVKNCVLPSLLDRLPCLVQNLCLSVLI